MLTDIVYLQAPKSTQKSRVNDEAVTSRAPDANAELAALLFLEIAATLADCSEICTLHKCVQSALSNVPPCPNIGYNIAT